MNKSIILIGSILLVIPFIMLTIDAISGDYKDSFTNKSYQVLEKTDQFSLTNLENFDLSMIDLYRAENVELIWF